MFVNVIALFPKIGKYALVVFPDAAYFCVDDGLASVDEVAGAFQYLQFHSLHIDLEEIAAGKVQGIQRDCLDGFSFRVVQHGHPAPVLDFFCVQYGNLDDARLVGYTVLPAIDIPQAVDGNVPCQQLENKALRLKGPYNTCIAHNLRQMDGVGPDIGTYLHNAVPGEDHLLKSIGLPLGKLPIQF